MWAMQFSLNLFQFTPLREGRPAVLRVVFLPFVFQFTPLREGRHDDGTRVLKSYLFQFTPLREGRRDRLRNSRDCPHISIHAPPRGAT